MAKQLTGWRSRIVGQGDEAPDQLMANPRNWRIHPKAQQDALAGALDQVGWVQRVIVNRQTGHLVDGHLRVELALSRGEPTVPVEYVDLTPEEEGLVLASLDPIAAMAGQDDEKLRQLLAEVEFDSKALESAIQELAPTKVDGLTDPDDVPDVDQTEVYVKRGDVWLLGAHRLMCGDSTDAAQVSRLMNGKSAHATVTDPPYGIGYEYGTHDDSNNEANARLVQDALALGPDCRVWTPGKMNLARDLSWNSGAKVLCWWKHFAAAGNGLGGASTWEPILVVRAKNAHLADDHLDFMTDREPGLRDSHPCPKPIALWEALLRAFVPSGNIVYEPFSGSGTTLLASERVGVSCYAMEIDPRYVQVAIERWEKFTGRKAERVDG